MNEKIQEWVKALDTLPIQYSIKPAGHILMPCPFHQERHPSLRIWTNGTWFCFGCGISRSGDEDVSWNYLQDGDYGIEKQVDVELEIASFLNLFKERYPSPLHPNQMELDLK